MKIRKKNVKLSQKLSAGMAVIIGAGLLVAYIFVHLVVFDVVNEDALESAFSYRLSHARLIDAWLAEQANTVRNLAEALPLVDNKNFQYIMSHYYGIHGYAESVWVVFADNTYYNSALVDLGDDVNFTEQSWWALAEAADGDVVFTSPYASHVRDGDIIVTVARYMHNLVGQPAVVGMSISLEHLSEIISNYGRQTETRLILVGIYGEIIIHPSREYMPAPGGVPTLMRHIEAYACVYEQMRLGEYIFRCDYHEDNLYYMQFPLASTGWTLVSEIPRAIALAPVWDTIIIVSLAIVFVLGLVAVFMFVFFSRVFIRPIAILTKDVSELTAGNHDVRIANTMRNDEIGTLSKAIRTTFRKIQYTQEIQRERIQRIVDAAPMCVTCYDTTFMMFDCNEAALRMFGIKTKEEFVNAFRERFFDFFPEVQPCGKTTAELAKISFEQAAKTGRCSVLVDHITADGEPLATDVMLSRIEYADTFMIVCYVHDLREEKKARDERRRREVAEETDRAKSRFLARMSHEIRTPITAVLGIAEIELQNLGMPPQLEESLVKIHTSADMLLGIVNDVLDLSKIESDKMELIEEEYETASMINDVTQLHPAYLCSKNIAFHLTVDQNLPQHLFGDCLRIKQILSNLLSNAFKYTESGRVDLEWRSDGTTLLISLRDTGMGMTREQIDLLSGEYLRFHENENRVIGGTGLGMPIVFSLIRLMNGEILIDSEPGVGTHLQLRIPQKPGKTSGEIGKDLAERLQKFESDTRALGKRFSFVPEPMPYGSVLVVDDVSENIYVIRGLLAFYDLRVDVCKSGPEAIERVKSGKTYDVIFMDHMMPVMTGIEAMKKIRETGYKNPIVALTANALVGVADDFIKSGFDGFISKPIQTKHLNTVLHRFVRDRHPEEVIQAALKVHNEATSNIYDFRHDAGLVEKLKRLFAQKHKNTFADIKAAIDKGDITHARLLAHTLKSVANLIHEAALSNAAQQIEHVLVANETPSAEKMSVLESEISRVLAGIMYEPTLSNPDELLVILNNLEPLLEANNASCLDFLDKLGAIPEAFIICKQIEEFNYEDALKNLNILRKNLM